MKRGHTQNAVKNFRKFHGRPVEKQTAIDFTMPKALTFLGEGHAVEYRNSGKARAAGGKGREPLRHLFGRGVKIYLHPNRRWIIIGGGKFRVTDWMRD